jgi:protein involved in polysaccharide export with SLBB domain
MEPRFPFLKFEISNLKFLHPFLTSEISNLKFPSPNHNSQFIIHKFLPFLCLFLLPLALPATDVKFTDLPNLVSNTPAVSALADTSASTNAPKSSSTNSMEALDDKYKLAIGDKLSFRIVEDEEDPKPLFVTDSGDLEIPYIGRFPAIAKTCKQLAQDLKAELCKEYFYQATVIIAVDLMTKSRGKVYVVGPVRAPGPQDIPSDETLTLSKAILRAGGFGDFADKHNVRITRKSGSGSKTDQTFIVDVAQILEKGKTDLDLPLEPGDFIYVPERSIRF